MSKPEEYRNRWALGLSVTLSVFIFVSFAFYKGYLSFGSEKLAVGQKYSEQVASVVIAPSPVENTRKTFETAFEEINKKYQEFKDSLSAVFVPFITGIEVYERDTK